MDEISKHFFDPVAIMGEVVERVPDAKLYLVGGDSSGANLQRLKAKVTEAGLNESIILCGFQKDVAPYYQSASVFFMTSAFEGFPMALAEAMSFGLPVVMYDLPYLTLVQRNQGIISVPQRDTEAAAAEICKLLEDKAYRQKVGTHGRAFLENLYSGNPVAEQWRVIFDSIGQPLTAPEESETNRLLFRMLLEHYRLSMEAKGTGKKMKNMQLIFGIGNQSGTASDPPYTTLRAAGNASARTVAFVTTKDGKNQFYKIIQSNGKRNWATPDEMRKMERTIADLREQMNELPRLRAEIDELRKALSSQEPVD